MPPSAGPSWKSLGLAITVTLFVLGVALSAVQSVSSAVAKHEQQLINLEKQCMAKEQALNQLQKDVSEMKADLKYLLRMYGATEGGSASGGQ